MQQRKLTINDICVLVEKGLIHYRNAFYFSGINKGNFWVLTAVQECLERLAVASTAINPDQERINFEVYNILHA